MKENDASEIVKKRRVRKFSNTPLRDSCQSDHVPDYQKEKLKYVKFKSLRENCELNISMNMLFLFLRLAEFMLGSSMVSFEFEKIKNILLFIVYFGANAFIIKLFDDGYFRNYN